MRVIMYWVINKDLEYTSTQMVIVMWASGIMIGPMGKEQSIMPMAPDMKEHGNKIKKMEMEFYTPVREK